MAVIAPVTAPTLETTRLHVTEHVHMHASISISASGQSATAGLLALQTNRRMSPFFSVLAVVQILADTTEPKRQITVTLNEV